MDVLHLSFNETYSFELKSIFEKYYFNFESLKINDDNNSKYNMTKLKSNIFWEKYKDIFKKFDVIIITDTPPIIRILLNNYKGKIILWMNSKIDYFDRSSLDYDEFPDEEYYKAINTDKAIFLSMNEIFIKQAKKINNFNQPINIIYPIGYSNIKYQTAKDDEKKNYFIYSNYNEIKLNLEKELNNMNIFLEKEFKIGLKGIIHIPFEWNSFEMFEKLYLNSIFFIPTMDFFEKLFIKFDLFWQEPYNSNSMGILKYSNWYNPIFSDFFIYFNSWEDLKEKVSNFKKEDIEIKTKLIFNQHKKFNLKKWENLIKSKLTNNFNVK